MAIAVANPGDSNAGSDHYSTTVWSSGFTFVGNAAVINNVLRTLALRCLEKEAPPFPSNISFQSLER